MRASFIYNRYVEWLCKICDLCSRDNGDINESETNESIDVNHGVICALWGRLKGNFLWDDLCGGLSDGDDLCGDLVDGERLMWRFV